MMHRLSILVCLSFAFLPALAQDKKKPPAKPDPRVFFSVPLGAAPAKTTKITLRGSSLDEAKEVRVVEGKASVKVLTKGKAGVPDKNPDRVGDTQVEIELKLDADHAGDTVSLVVITPVGETRPYPVLVERTLPTLAEKESNDAFRTAHAVALPIVIDGAIGRPKDIDMIRFEGKKGQKVRAEVLASRQGSPLDPLLTLYDVQFQQRATSDDFDKDHRDARIDYVLPADGVYYLSLIDAHDTGSNLHVYRLVVR